MANRIKELRLKNHFSQQELAEKTGISNQSISFYENGKRIPKIEAWQRIANVFGVSVSYLQGEEPDFSTITDKTKLTISLILDNYYFGQKEDYILSYRIGKEIFDVDNLDKKEWNSTFSKCQISITESKQTYDYVNQYIKLSNWNNEPVTADEKYWMKNFGFLLKKEKLIKSINRELFRKSKIKAMSAEQLVSGCNVFARRINNNLYESIIEKFGTDLGKYINQGSYKSELGILEDNFRLSLRTASSIQSMRKAVNDYEKNLNILIDKIKPDETNGKLAKYIEKEKEKEEDLQQAEKFYKEFDELYSKDKEFEKFAKNYEEKHHVGMRIVNEKGEVINANLISKTNKLPCLYEYKQKNNEDASQLYALLKKYSVIS